MKKFTLWTLILVLFCGIFATGFLFKGVFRRPDNRDINVRVASWDSLASGSLTGNGSIETPYLISTAGDLAFLSLKFRGSDPNFSLYYNKYYKFEYTLSNGGIIDLSGNSFVPIGASALTLDFITDGAAFNSPTAVFSGHFNGEYFDGGERKFLEITGLTDGALFGATELAHIRNIDFINVNISGGMNAAGAVVNYGIDTEVRNVSVEGTVRSHTTVGGIDRKTSCRERV